MTTAIDTLGPQALLQHGRAVLAQQPFSALLGATLADLAPGRAELHLPVRPDLHQQHGFVHGGALSYLVDNALTFAGGSVLGNCVTAEYKINYLRPAASGTGRLVARAEAVTTGRTQAVCRCELFLHPGDEGGGAAPATPVLCAVAQGTIRKLE